MFVVVVVFVMFFLVIYYLVGACKGLRRGELSGFVFASIYSVSSSCVFFQISVMYSSSDRILVVGFFR